MFYYNFNRIFKARGISNPFVYLMEAGFSDRLASRIKNGQVRLLRMKELEKFCKALKCTPNDLIEWVPESDNVLPGDHPLYDLKHRDRIADITGMLSNLPLNQIDELADLIMEKVKANS